jgi:dTDP-4-amino-4,6-dideoxygalactose transaminase
VVQSPQRDALKAYLQDNGIGTLIHYPSPVHSQPAYKGRVATGIGGLRHSEEACRKVLSLPMYSQLTDDQALWVCEMLSRWANSRNQN